jgi:arabinofuranosyltransferase
LYLSVHAVLGRGLCAALGTLGRAQPRSRSLLAQSLLLGVLLGYLTIKFFLSRRFYTPMGLVWGVLDDVYITASHARTLVNGGGPLWYEGAPRVEGFSSPLWLIVLAALHLNPALEDYVLGVHVLIVNLVVLLALGAVMSVVIGDRDAEHRLTRPSWGKWLVLVLLQLTSVSHHYWTGAGFETGLTALLALGAFALAGGPASARRATSIGLLLGTAFWSRMDSVLLCWPVLGVMWFERRWRRLIPRTAALWIALAAFLFVSRRAYFGEWLPNTYYLKATGWALGDRLIQGFLQNRAAIYCLLFGILPLCVLLLPRVLHRRSEIAGLVLAHAGTVAYSTWLGGDFAWSVYGYDRFTGTSVLLLTCALARLVTEPPLYRWARALAMPALAASMLAPVFLYFNPYTSEWLVHQPFRFKALVYYKKSLNAPDLLNATFVYYGRAIEQITKPGAVVAVCAAGAIPYFSHRRAIDLLGKIDKHVARLPVLDHPPPEYRCWRPFPGAGHNKEDTSYSFAQRPDLSTVDPPEKYRSQYRKAVWGGLDFWLRQDSKLVIIPEGDVRKGAPSSP